MARRPDFFRSKIIFANLYWRVYVCLNVCMYVCVRVYMYIYIYVLSREQYYFFVLLISLFETKANACVMFKCIMYVYYMYVVAGRR